MVVRKPGVQNPHCSPWHSEERLLHRPQRAVGVGQPLDRGDLAVDGRDREHQARPHRPAVDQHRARAADAVLAADVGAGQAQVVAQRVGEQATGGYGDVVRDAVDLQADLVERLAHADHLPRGAHDPLRQHPHELRAVGRGRMDVVAGVEVLAGPRRRGRRRRPRSGRRRSAPRTPTGNRRRPFRQSPVPRRRTARSRRGGGRSPRRPPRRRAPGRGRTPTPRSRRGGARTPAGRRTGRRPRSCDGPSDRRPRRSRPAAAAPSASRPPRRRARSSRPWCPGCGWSRGRRWPGPARPTAARVVRRRTPARRRAGRARRSARRRPSPRCRPAPGAR